MRHAVVIPLLLIGLASADAVQAQPAAKKYALLVGVNNYEYAALNRPKPLEYAEADVTALAEVLRKAGYEVDLLTGTAASRDAVATAIDKLKQRGNAAGVVLVAFAGRGVQFDPADEAYFCPHDAGLRDIRRDGKPVLDRAGKPMREPDPEGCVRLTDVLRQFDGAKAGTRILLADCGRNDPTAGWGTSRAVGAGLTADRLPANTAVLLSCSARQIAHEDKRWKHGAFFHHVLEGLRGDRTTVNKLVAHLETAVPESVKKLPDAPKQEPRLLVNGDRLDFGLTPAAVVVAPPVERGLSAAYYPLNDGDEWLYVFGETAVRVVVTDVKAMDGTKTATLASYSGDKKVAAATEVVRVDKEGIHRTAVNQIAAEPPVQMLSAAPKAGDKWKVATKIQSAEVVGTTEVVGVVDIEVPAGKFKALHTHGKLKIGGTDAEVRTWYVRDIGIVKLGYSIGGTTVDMELKAYKPAKKVGK